jgi:hypothetical protein
LAAENNPESRKDRPHAMVATAPPTQGLQDGGVGSPGKVSGHMQHVRPPLPPHVGQYPPMLLLRRYLCCGHSFKEKKNDNTRKEGRAVSSGSG